MADDALLIGDLALNPAAVNDYMESTYNDQWQAFAAGWAGCIVTKPVNPDLTVGQVYYAPRMSMIKAAEKLDVTNETAKDTTRAPGGANIYGPVISNVMFPVEWFTHALKAMKKNDAAFEATLAQMTVQRLINARKLDVLYALRGAIGALSTSTHVNDESGNTVKTAALTDLMDTKQLLGDAQGSLRVAVLHSKVWLSIKKDLVTGSNYNIERIGDMVVMGNVPGLEGLSIILCDDGTKVAGASAGADAYYSFLVGEGAVEITPAANSPLFTTEVSLGKGARSVKFACEDHYALIMPGVSMSTDGTGNPTVAELYDTANWSEAFMHDHRDFKAVYLKTLNG